MTADTLMAAASPNRKFFTSPSELMALPLAWFSAEVKVDAPVVASQ